VLRLKKNIKETEKQIIVFIFGNSTPGRIMREEMNAGVFDYLHK